MKVSAPTHPKGHHEAHHGKTKEHDSGFEELLHATPEKAQKVSSTAARAVTPLPASGHLPPVGGKGSTAAAPGAAHASTPVHFKLAALPKIGSHVVVPKEEKEKKKTPAHPAQPQQAVEQPLAKLEVEAPKPIAAAPSQPVTPVAAQVQQAAAPAEVKAVLAPLPPLPIDPALAQQDSLRVLLLPHAAKVSVETADAGRLEVRVDVHDGVAHVRASGEAAPMVDLRTNELRVALAQEGLALGNFELGQQQRRPDDPERPSDASGFRRAQPAAKSATEGQKSLDGGLHIQV